MDLEHLSDVYLLIQGQGAQVVTANAVGGGSNLYLAGSLRAPRETFERRDRRPGDGPPRRMWPRAISRATLNPYYARAERGLRVNRPTWDQVSKSGGLWAATLASAGYTCDRVPLAISPVRCVNAKWCHTGCIFGAKNSLITNYLWAAEHAGVQVLPNLQVELIRQSSARPYRYVIEADVMDNDGAAPSRAPTGQQLQFECKVVVVAAGAMGTPPLLLRSRPFLPSLSDQVGRNLGVNGDHVAAAEFDPARVRSVLGLPGYHEFYKGKPITTMSYDWWVGRRGHEYDGTRFTLQEIFLSTLTNFLYDSGRPAHGGPSWWGPQKKQAVAHWSNRIELLAMVEDTHDGTFYAAPPSGAAARPNAGPIAVGTFNYAMSEQSLAIRGAANDAIRGVVSRRGLARFMALTETQGVYCAHPLGGARMAESPDLGVVSDTGAVHGYEGLFCIDGSIVPTSLGVNPSLTISALTERCAEHLVAHAAELGLPAAPGFRARVPPEHIGPRVHPATAPARRRRRRPTGQTRHRKRPTKSA
jgi:choline dehydrogenase-like flavoprotein